MASEAPKTNILLKKYKMKTLSFLTVNALDKKEAINKFRTLARNAGFHGAVNESNVIEVK